MLTTQPNRVSALFADPFETVLRELDGKFPWGGHGNGFSQQSFAPLSMWEDESAYHIDVDVPGIALADLDVSMEQGTLTIRGERKAPDRQEFLRQERAHGQFERIIALNEWVDPGTIQAALQDGVLHLTLSKKPECQRQKIDIRYGGAPDAKRIEQAT